MNTDDDHYRSSIFLASESMFPELFEPCSKKIDLGALGEKEYFDKKLGIIGNSDNIDILGLPTEKLNSFKLAEFGENISCEEVNREIAAAVKCSQIQMGKKLAGVLGPSDIYIDPFSETSFTELISAYDEQVNGLEEYVDLFIINNVSSMSDMRAALLSCKKTEKPVFVIISPTDTDSEEAGGISALGALVTAQEMGADAFGISCGNYESASEYLEAVKELLLYTKIHIIADLKQKSINTKSFQTSKYIKYISVDNDSLTVSKKLTRIDDELSEIKRHDDFFVFTYYAYTFFLEADTTEISEPIICLPDMEEIISEICKTSCDVLRVEINSNDDAIDFARNAHMTSRPVMFLSEDPLALKMALMLYQGIALIDSDTMIPKEELDEMCAKYGAVVY